MRIVVARPNKAAVITDVPDGEILPLQYLVEGYIECHRIKDGVRLLVNEEGRLYGFPINRELMGVAWRGNIVIAGVDEQRADFCSLSETQALIWKGWLDDALNSQHIL